MAQTGATITLFEDEVSRLDATRTFVIFGVRRGGTTSVAGVMQRLGLHIGEGIGRNLEDRAFRLTHGIEPVRETVAARNAAFATWGWKYPNPHRYLPDILPLLRNPRFVVVTRDLAANAASIARRDNWTPDKALNHAVESGRRNAEFVTATKRPTLYVSYERLLHDPERAVGEIAGFFAAEPGAGRRREIADYVKPGVYQATAEEAAGVPRPDARPAPSGPGRPGLGRRIGRRIWG